MKYKKYIYINMMSLMHRLFNLSSMFYKTTKVSFIHYASFAFEKSETIKLQLYIK